MSAKAKVKGQVTNFSLIVGEQDLKKMPTKYEHSTPSGLRETNSNTRVKAKVEARVNVKA